MRSFRSGLMLAALLGAVLAVAATPASAEFFGCKDPKVTVRNYSGVSSHFASVGTTHEYSAQSSRPRVTIYPRHRRLTANSVRQCRARLVEEHRASGTVIVPRMQCWWE